MKLIATSDLHGFLPEIPECDILLIGGDVTPIHNHNRKFQADWLREDFCPWLKSVPAKSVVWTAGNHDFVLQDMSPKKRDTIGGIYLDSEHVVIDGLKIWGSAMSPTFGNWAFMRDDAVLFDIWETIPADTEIIIVHGPPHGYGDLTQGWMGSAPENVGSKTLRNRMRELNNLKLVVTGHIHPAYGTYTTLNGVTVLNVSHVNEQYDPVNPVMVFEL
jgi:Icc-related predicted phosphoesterase